MAPTGSLPEDHGYTSLDLLKQIASFMIIVKCTRVFPPLAVCNDLFGRSERDEGMSGGVCWEPFIITEEERLSIKDGLSKYFNIELVEMPAQNMIESYSDWEEEMLTVINS